MTPASDRRHIMALIDEALVAGARPPAACAELGLHPRTLRRWKDTDGAICEDGRPFAARPVPANTLNEEERDRIMATCNAPEFSSLPPSQIVPRLADRDIYTASEASFYRVLHERGQTHRRGRARPPAWRKPPNSFAATGPCEVWSWDITWLPGPILGSVFYLSLIVDIFSRKIVGLEVYDRETAEFAAQMLKRAVRAEQCLTSPLVLHAHNGSPLSCTQGPALPGNG
ncbi:DDE-type integrase/transposase/recombinase [Jannaschia sp.]|nr:DDE-type integrase/transposase/recombinase [Jannaschia sp.]